MARLGQASLLVVILTMAPLMPRIRAEQGVALTPVPAVCAAPLTPTLRPAVRIPRDHIALPAAGNIPPGPVAAQLPLYPGATSSTLPMPHAAYSYPASTYLKSATAEYLLPTGWTAAESWYRQAFTVCGYRETGNSTSAVRGSVTSIGLDFQGPQQPPIDASLAFEHAAGGQTLVFYLTYTVVLPPPAVLVPGHPTSLTILAYLPPSPGQLAAPHPSKYVVVRDRRTIQALVHQLNSLPPVQGLTSCPMDNGSHNELRFTYPHGRRVTVEVELTGCRAVQSGGRFASGAAHSALFNELAALLAGPSAVAPSYTVTRVADGIQLTVQFQRRAYPAHALIAIAATLRNLSHPHLAVTHAPYPYGPCSGPAVSLEAVNAVGQDAAPNPPILPPIHSCPAPVPRPLPIGQRVTEHQLIVLWAPRLRITAQLFNVVHNCYCGFTFPAAFARFRLYHASAPAITIQNTTGGTVAAVSPPVGAQGPLYYQSWGTCSDDQAISGAFYWTPWPDHTVPAMCAHPRQWHLDVAWLNTPIASLNLGA